MNAPQLLCWYFLTGQRREASLTLRHLSRKIPIFIIFYFFPAITKSFVHTFRFIVNVPYITIFLQRSYYHILRWIHSFFSHFLQRLSFSWCRLPCVDGVTLKMTGLPLRCSLRNSNPRMIATTGELENELRPLIKFGFSAIPNAMGPILLKVYFVFRTNFEF